MRALVISWLMISLGMAEAMVASGDMKAIGAGVAVNGAYIFPCALIWIGAKSERGPAGPV